jgi:hypothetical protein
MAFGILLRGAGRRLFLVALAVVCILVPSRESAAEFLRTATSVYQSIGRRAKIVVGAETPGLFLYYGPEIDLQDFGVESLQFSATDSENQPLHAFLRYDGQAGRYSAFVVGPREYRIQGNFTVNIGAMRVTVDNINQYVSIVVDEPDHRPEILGFFGTSAVINDQGQEAVEMLEGNQINEYRAVFSPYTLRSDGLFVKDKPVTSGSMGLIIEPKNPCLRPGAAIISRAAFQKLSSIADSSKAKLLLKQLLAERKKNPLDATLRLRTTDDLIIGLDPVSNQTFLVRVAPSTSSAFSPDGIGRICVIDQVRAEK